MDSNTIRVLKIVLAEAGTHIPAEAWVRVLEQLILSGEQGTPCSPGTPRPVTRLRLPATRSLELAEDIEACLAAQPGLSVREAAAAVMGYIADRRPEGYYAGVTETWIYFRILRGFRHLVAVTGAAPDGTTPG